MTDLADLLKEAKPLYFARKRHRKYAKLTSVLCAIALFGFTFYGRSNVSSPIFDAWSEEIYQAQNGSAIEDLGLPVDEFGLLWIA